LKRQRSKCVALAAVEKIGAIGYNSMGRLHQAEERSPMKRFIWTLVLLIVTSLAVFLVGWLPLRVEPGKYAVVASKTGGVEDEVLYSGRFFWSAAALLPTNLRLVQFSPARLERVIGLSGELPSAGAYRAFMAGEPDFSWDLSLRLRIAVEPEALPLLFSRYGIDSDEALGSWLNEELEGAASDARSLASEALVSASDAARLSSGAADEDLRLALAARRPQLDILGLSVIAARVPDLLLYEQARQLYGSYMESYRQSVEPALVRASVSAAEDQVRMDTLKRYGELLARYPALIDFLAIEAGIAPRPLAEAAGLGE
jgi:hypothetical protein